MELTQEILQSVRAANPCKDRWAANRRAIRVDQVSFADLAWIESQLQTMTDEFLSGDTNEFLRCGKPQLCLLGHSGSGYGDGYGHGDGDGYGHGDGHGDGDGYGYGYGYGDGDGDGYSDGHGDGYGDGHGDGYGYGHGNGDGYGGSESSAN